MALEDQITRLIASLDANTAAIKGAKGGTTAAATVTKPTTAAKAGPDFDQVKVAAEKVMAKHGKPFAKKMIMDVGGAKELAAVKPEKYPALFKAFGAAMTEVEEETAEEEDEL